MTISTGHLWLLGAVAGFTIFLGLPLARIERPMPALRMLLNGIAVGILVFLLFDILAHANETVEGALTGATDEGESWWRFAWYAALFGAGVGMGLLGLLAYERWQANRRFGPGAADVRELRAPGFARLTGADRLALEIALGIGLHNFSEGLAIGQSAASGEVTLALSLVIGFALHNATEGFGIVAPLAGEEHRPTWRFLAILGVIGGGPTFVGTLVGNRWVNSSLFLVCLALAAGSILYVVIQLVQVAAKTGHRERFMAGVFTGLVAGFATDYVLVAVGA